MDAFRRSDLKPARLRFLGVVVAINLLAASSSLAQPWIPWPGSYDPTAGDGVPGGDREPSPIVDALGDASDTFGTGPPLLDIDRVTVEFDESELHFSMTFHTPVSPPWSDEPDTLVGVLEFDVDQNPLTGIAPLQTGFSPPFAFLVAGNDFLLVFAPDFVAPGVVSLVETTSGATVAAVPVDFGPMGFTGSIPLAQLGGDDGVVDFTAIIGTVPQPTDALEVVGFSVERSEAPVPTMSAWGVVALGLLLAAGVTIKFGRRPRAA